MNQDSQNQRWQTICLMFIAAVLGMYAVYWLRPVLVPFVLAVFVVSGVTPLLNWLESRLKINRLIAMSFISIVSLVAVAGLVVCVWLSVQQLAEEGDAYTARVTEIVEKSQDWVKSKVDSFTPTASEDAIPESEPIQLGSGAQFKITSQVDEFVKRGIGLLSSELLALVSTSIVVLIYVMFMLFGEVNAFDRESTVGKIDEQIRSYLSMKTIISLGTGFVVGLVLWLLGVPMALTFGLLAFLLNYIPNIGPVISSVLPIPLILLHPEATWSWIIAAISASVLIQAISGNMIEPKLMGNSSDLHPVVVLLGLMFWGMMWGIVGMFLATPIMAAIKIILDRIEPTKKLADIMAGRWSTAPETKGRI